MIPILLQLLSLHSFFVEFNILSFTMICRRTKTHLNPGPAPALQPAPQPQPPPRRKRKPPNPWVMPWILQREERECYRTPMVDLIHTDIPGYQNFVRMPPAFLWPHRRTHTPLHQEVGLKLTITLRYQKQQEKPTHPCNITGYKLVILDEFL